MASHNILFLFGFALLMTLGACEPQCKQKVGIKYTLFEGDDIDKVVNIHLNVNKNSTFYEAMVKGADEDCKFLFTATENEQYGHFVTSIGGLEQDLEANKYWMIYVTDSPANPAHPPTDYDLSDFGVDSIIVQNGKNYIFWYKTVIW